VDVFVGLKVVGLGGIIKTGPGTLEIGNPGSVHTYSGATTVNAGTLLITGNISSSLVTVNNGLLQVNTGGAVGPVTVNGGTLGGSGIVGSITATDGVVAPGASAGTLTSGSFDLGLGADFSIELGGLSAGFEYDQLLVNGDVNLAGNFQGSLINGFIPQTDDTFFILLNDGLDSITGAFAGLAEGSTVDFGGATFTVTYLANGDGGAIGNDLALVTQVPEPASLMLLLGGTCLVAARRRRQGGRNAAR
jgi:autotransporter-associated beta strand protein